MRIKSWTINCFVFLVAQVLVGPFGLRCLFGVEKFDYDETINYNTGAKSHLKRETLVYIFREVLKGIKKSRDNF